MITNKFLPQEYPMSKRKAYKTMINTSTLTPLSKRLTDK